MTSFQDLDRHFGALPPERVQALVVIAEARGREEVLRRQNPAGLETLRAVALIQSAEASNAIENIHASRERIEALIADKTTPQNRSEQEIAGYRLVLDQIHANGPDIPFESRFVEQLHGSLSRFTGDRTAGKWKGVDNRVEEHHPDGTVVERFRPVSAADTPTAMKDLHAGFARAMQEGRHAPLLLVATYVLDFLVIHPFRDRNGRMARLNTLWLLYVCGHEVGRYISIEKLIEESRETYYEALHRSTLGWHERKHDLGPWTDYFLGIVVAAYRELENRTALVNGRGSKRALITFYIRASLSDEFKVAQIRDASPGVSDAYISKVLGELKADGAIEPVGRGRGAGWRRLRPDVE
ncbi:Fic family protein [Baekduia sp.]|uniref:Fic family protein n=1 Tax=Baekduia sp. TaxID=2600305 RepID=UPI002E0C5E2A|nr:Fic family protein [Baekduia sp.]